MKENMHEDYVDVLSHLAECIYFFFYDGEHDPKSPEAVDLMSDCQTMALLIGKSMSLSVSAVENDEITIKVKLSNPFEFLDQQLNS